MLAPGLETISQRAKGPACLFREQAECSRKNQRPSRTSMGMNCPAFLARGSGFFGIPYRAISLSRPLRSAAGRRSRVWSPQPLDNPQKSPGSPLGQSSPESAQGRPWPSFIRESPSCYKIRNVEVRLRNSDKPDRRAMTNAGASLIR
jgi:hypothetical protein